MAGNSRTNRATAGSSCPLQRCTEMTSASTCRRRAAESTSRNESTWSAVKAPSPAASTRGRSGSGSTVQTVTIRPYGKARPATAAPPLRPTVSCSAWARAASPPTSPTSPLLAARSPGWAPIPALAPLPRIACEQRPIHFQVGDAEAHEPYERDRRGTGEALPHGPHRNLRRPRDRVAVGARADGREGDRADGVLRGEGQRVDVAAAQQGGLSVMPPLPHRPH